MAFTSSVIRIRRGAGGEVEADGEIDKLASDVLRHAGFLSEPTLRGVWIRLPFDMGRAWENAHAARASQMLTAVGYAVDLNAGLVTASLAGTPPQPPSSAIQPPDTETRPATRHRP
jgi:hypothetical protein